MQIIANQWKGSFAMERCRFTTEKPADVKSSPKISKLKESEAVANRGQPGQNQKRKAQYAIEVQASPGNVLWTITQSLTDTGTMQALGGTGGTDGSWRCRFVALDWQDQREQTAPTGRLAWSLTFERINGYQRQKIMNPRAKVGSKSKDSAW